MKFYGQIGVVEMQINHPRRQNALSIGRCYIFHKYISSYDSRQPFFSLIIVCKIGGLIIQYCGSVFSVSFRFLSSRRIPLIKMSVILDWKIGIYFRAKIKQALGNEKWE